jgi:hypothetical protein
MDLNAPANPGQSTGSASAFNLWLLRHAFHRVYPRLDLRLDRLEIDARPPLHRRIVDERLRAFADLLCRKTKRQCPGGPSVTEAIAGSDLFDLKFARRR